MLIDILIPTYNRKEFLLDNIQRVEREIKEFNLQDSVKLLISDNASSDGSARKARHMKSLESTIVFEQKNNVGLEENVLFLLGESKAEYILFLGDDDELPYGYLKWLITLLKDNSIGLVIPGITARYADGREVVVRKGKERRIKPGSFAQTHYAYLTHQLSGCVFKRNQLLSAYTAKPAYKNIYPFIYFALLAQKEGYTIYNPCHSVRVFEGNSKDWRYNEIGLLDEIAKNYNSIFGLWSLYTLYSLVVVLVNQSWRMRTNKLSTFTKSAKKLLKSHEFSFLSRAILPTIMLPFAIKNSVVRVSNEK